ncbi:DUF4397 domain-containing protein [Hymenobacter aquaticus]|uniref:DUF4397 domain-containing protein n=1 Tax=Hymenobacter aquaticus TaxID=1867101 RepID=A0A4Z0Q6C3_9BACT|nr:DUF4397 domain-containing protein [Hymenobacter aquaticus]TGE25640.1 DUF4397 domain-containing protein [Hymenobacter aquaticus]
MRIFSSSYLPKLALVGSLAAALVSCEDPELPEAKPVSASTVGQSKVLVVNAAPGSTGIAATAENISLGAPLAYLGSASTTFNAGQRLFVFNEPTNIAANPANYPKVGNPPVDAPPVNTTARTVTSRTSFLGGTNYTVFLTDQPTRPFVFPVTNTSDLGGIRTLIVTDNLAAPAAGKAKVRFFNLSPSLTTAVGVYNTTAPAAFLFSARSYRAVSTGSGSTLVNFNTFTEVNAGAYTLDVRATATAAPVVAAKVYTFEAGKIYTLYASGLTGSSTTPLALSVVTHN